MDITNSTEIEEVIDAIEGIKTYREEISKNCVNQDTTNQIALFKTINGIEYEGTAGTVLHASKL